MDFPRRVFAPWPAAPGNNATILLFNTHPKVPTGGTALVRPTLEAVAGIGGVDKTVINFVELVALRNNQAGAPNGIRVYALQSDGATFTEVDVKDDNQAASIGSVAPKTFPVVAAGAEYRLLIDISRYRGVAIEYTAGATGPTAGISTWDGTITLHLGAEAIIR